MTFLWLSEDQPIVLGLYLQPQLPFNGMNFQFSPHKFERQNSCLMLLAHGCSYILNHGIVISIYSSIYVGKVGKQWDFIHPQAAHFDWSLPRFDYHMIKPLFLILTLLNPNV